MTSMTSSNHQPSQSNSHAYPLASNIPLIKAPGIWLPKPIVLPADLHPMPDDITAYFVYPYSLEASSLAYLSSLSSHRKNLEASRASAQAYLESRQARKAAEREQAQKEAEQRRRDLLRRVAPGWSGEMNSILGSSEGQQTN